MSKCTAAQAAEAFAYWLGYCEKATARYADRREKTYFETDRGSNNYTYAGHICGVQGGAWCAMMVSTAVLEACGGSLADAKAVLWGVWPYTVCNQLYDAAPASAKGRRGAWKPRAGDVIVFTDDGSTRTHTGMVYAADESYVYTYEGNSADQCRKRSYLLTSAYIYGYVRPDYAESEAAEESSGELYGPKAADMPLYTLSKGCAGPEVAGLDGFYTASFEVYGDFCMMLPKEPDKVCARIKEETGVTCMLVDANDFERDILGKSPDLTLTDEQCAEFIRDNPTGNSTQLTPFVLIRKAAE